MFVLTGCKDPVVLVDFEELPELSSQNYYVVCPPNYCSIKPNEISPVFPFDMHHLDIHWQEVVSKQNGLKLIAEDKQKLLYTYVQRTKYLRLPQVINVQLLPIDKNHSTLAIYSQSKYGYFDFGANKNRVNEWLKDLRDSVGKQHNLEIK